MSVIFWLIILGVYSLQDCPEHCLDCTDPDSCSLCEASYRLVDGLYCEFQPQCPHCVLSTTTEETQSAESSSCKSYFINRFGSLATGHYHQVAKTTSSYKLVMGLYNQRLCLSLYDYNQLKIYRRIYSELDIGEQIHKQTDLRYIFDTFQLVVKNTNGNISSTKEKEA